MVSKRADLEELNLPKFEKQRTTQKAEAANSSQGKQGDAACSAPPPGRPEASATGSSACSAGVSPAHR
jgi:hypothetical protein